MAVCLVATACASDPDPSDSTPFGQATDVAVSVSAETFVVPDSADCTGQFRPVTLPHETGPRGQVSAMGDGMGTGVTAEDIDGDGWIDLVLPNLAGDTSVLHNPGGGPSGFGDGSNWSAVAVADGRFRQALVADLDHDGVRDLILTTGLGPPQVYLNDADTGPWVRTEIRDLRLLAYSGAVGDLEGDGDIDLAFGSYNAELTARRDNRVLAGIDVGAAVYRPTGDLTFEEEPLAPSAQALVTVLADLDGDGHDDVIVGNDLGTPDQVWLGGPSGLTLTDLFDQTTLSTMSLDIADLDNDGDRDLVATDMAPMPDDPVEPWLRLADDIAAAQVDDVQRPTNAVNLAGEDGYTEVADRYGVSATGWSWSGITGDLDNDGLLDLHIVNGMSALDIFPDLPGGELVEPNQTFRGTGDDFEPMPRWGLGDTAGGRGMTMADLDNDGDLDVVVNNFGSPATLFINELCEGTAIEVELRWNGVQNLDALGATIIVDDGSTQRQRIVTGSRGYLSTSPSRAHFGLGDHEEPTTITVRWPDGAVSTIPEAVPGTLVTVTRDDGPLAPEEP